MRLIDDNGAMDFIDDNGIKCFIDDLGNVTCEEIGRRFKHFAMQI